MNELVSRFGSEKLAILGFPCNQFGKQENAKEEEILNLLRHVRPGNGFEPKIEMFCKVEVNGSDAHPLFQFLKESLPLPEDDQSSLMNDPKFIIWSPVTRNDIAWNFEKFLITPDGTPYKRFSKKYETIKLEKDIADLLEKSD
jgi:glutathione peroxidase